MTTSVIRFDERGEGHCLYTEAVDLSSIGVLQVTRASTIEFNQHMQMWEVRGPDGKLLYQDRSRFCCLGWEQEHFNR